MTAYEALTKKYELEASLQELESRCVQLEKEIPLLKHRKREAEVAAAEAQSSLRRFFDRLSGKGDAGSEALERSARAAAAALDTAQRELAVLQDKREKVCTEYEALGENATLMAQLSRQEQEHFFHVEAGILAEAAIFFLTDAEKELSAAQELARNPMMSVGDEGYRRNTHLSAAAEKIDRCRENLDRIAACGIVLPIHPYIQQPMGYLVTAQRYAVLDRMNSAQQGIRETQASLKELLLQLVE